MRFTILAPHWGANPDLHEFAEARLKCPDRLTLFGQFRGLPVRFSRALECEVIHLDTRVETMPECLDDVPMVSIQMIERSTDLTSLASVADGVYAEGDIIASVGTACEADKVVRIFRVDGGKNSTIEELNDWLDALIAGKKPRAGLEPAFLVAA
jgi:hypothetical protein